MILREVTPTGTVKLCYGGGGNPALGESVSFILGNKLAGPLPGLGITSLSSMSTHYTNILAQIIWDKRSQCFCLQDIQKMRDLQKTVSQH